MVLEYTWKALDDLERIKEMYSELSGPSSAMKHMETITRSIRLLTTSPTMGMSLQAKTGMTTDIRYIIVDKHYLVFYLVEEAAIHVRRILDGRTNYLPLIFEKDNEP